MHLGTREGRSAGVFFETPRIKIVAKHAVRGGKGERHPSSVARPNAVAERGAHAGHLEVYGKIDEVRDGGGRAVQLNHGAQVAEREVALVAALPDCRARIAVVLEYALL
jgi:hypothetical protein